jgi:hypothetical protein
MKQNLLTKNAVVFRVCAKALPQFGFHFGLLMMISAPNMLKEIFLIFFMVFILATLLNWDSILDWLNVFHWNPRVG